MGGGGEPRTEMILRDNSTEGGRTMVLAGGKQRQDFKGTNWGKMQWGCGGDSFVIRV